MTQAQYIYNAILNIKEKSPVLLVENAMILFKKMYKGHIHKLENTEDIKEFISEYSGIEYDKPLVIEDIALIYRDSILLKLIEEIKIPLILLASRDNISAPLKSRIKTYIKFTEPVNYNQKQLSFDEAIKHLEKENITDMNIIEDYLTENCAELMLWNTKLKSYRYKDRFLRLL